MIFQLEIECKITQNNSFIKQIVAFTPPFGLVIQFGIKFLNKSAANVCFKVNLFTHEGTA
jgi:hypothetical protein